MARDSPSFNKKEKMKMKSTFRERVEKSGFSRVCPRCYNHWSEKLDFLKENQQDGITAKTKTVYTSCERYEDILVQKIFSHKCCGGEMLLDYAETERKPSKMPTGM